MLLINEGTKHSSRSIRPVGIPINAPAKSSYYKAEKLTGHSRSGVLLEWPDGVSEDP